MQICNVFQVLNDLVLENCSVGDFYYLWNLTFKKIKIFVSVHAKLLQSNLHSKISTNNIV